MGKLGGAGLRIKMIVAANKEVDSSSKREYPIVKSGALTRLEVLLLLFSIRRI
jgi:hypothetical protein